MFLLCVAAGVVFFAIFLFLGASAIMLGTDVKAIMDNPLLINLYTTILILITVMIPWTSAKLKVAFVAFFAEQAAKDK